MSSLHRANEAIDNLQAVIDRQQPHAVSVDTEPQGLEQSKEVGANWVPVEIIQAAQNAVSVVLTALVELCRSIARSFPVTHQKGGERKGAWVVKRDMKTPLPLRPLKMPSAFSTAMSKIATLVLTP